MNKDQFENYLRKVFPEHIPGGVHKEFDFVLDIS